MLALDLVASVAELAEGLAVGPRVGALGGVVLVALLVLIGHSLFEQVRVTFCEADPLCLALEEAEVAAGAGAPLVVTRQAHAGALEQGKDVVLDEAGFLEREDWADGGLCADVAPAVLVRADTNVGEGRVVAEPLLEGLELEHGGAPAHLWTRQGSLVEPQPVVEAAFSVEAGDAPTQHGLQALQIFVRLGEFRTGVAEEVLQLRHLVTKVDRESGAVLTAADA